MALPDKTDYSKAFYEENIALTLQARREMPWGKTIPEREFKHFVLPVRVNNENLDDSRKVFYAELKNRVKHLSMKDAILEVNHWCHEKVTYRPTDGRTSSPLASVCTAYGRCGEESTFLVAALRSVGIPARQVYTPRWAHTDDNHAWVEAWADGKWYFLGACEPEPILNLGWFNESASRGMLMHTKVFGDYDGPEEVMSKTPLYTEINVISNYAPTAEVKVVVVDENGKRVKGAKVEFKLYNYAEFYSVAKKTTNDNGVATLTAGKGDMIVWASKDGKVGIDKVSFGKTKELRDLYSTASIWLVLFAAPIYALMAIYAPALMRILGDGFAPGANVLVVLCIGSIVTFMAGNIHSLLIMSGRSGWAAINKIVVLTLNVVGNVIFIPRGGMVAAAIVWAVCMVLDATMATVQVSRFIGVTPKLSEVVKPIVVVGMSAVIPGGCIAWWLGRDSFVATIGGSALSVLVFACVCWAFRDRLHLSGLGSLARRRRG